MHSATFVLSTGRCGTQWLAEKLGSVYADVLTVAHEPLHNRYHARRMLGRRAPRDLNPDEAAAILDHLDEIERGLATRPYVECGHPAWSAVPWLSERFTGRFRVLHLVRHPIPTALSWLTHMAYAPPLVPYLPEKVLLSPFDEGVAFPEYRERWGSMSPFEKCLYYWAEVNTLGLRLEETAGVPWLRVRFEELFTPPGISRILGFLGVSEREGMIDAGREVIDQHRTKVPQGFPDLNTFAGHPRFLEVAERLGYAPSWEDVDGLRMRYGLATP